MSKIHVLAGNGGSYGLIIHTNTPTGVNVVGNSWKACLLAAGLAKTSVMSSGAGIGLVPVAEAASILAGDVLEFQTALPAQMDGATPTVGQITAFADAHITSEFSRLQVALKFYGYTQ